LTVWVYVCLYRLDQKGLIDSAWRVTDNNRRAKFYRLTRMGRREAGAELDGWVRLSGAVTRVLRALEHGT
jgi:DNA-binding PadR family transcriptional regulator